MGRDPAHLAVARATPAGFAWFVEGANQTGDPQHGWLPFPHLTMLSEKLAQVAAGEVRRLIVTMPPRHGKSQLISQYFPAWYLGRYPRRQVIIASNTVDLAEDFSRGARDALLEYGPELFGVTVAGDSAAVKRWRTDHGGILKAAGVGVQITGRGAHLLVIDDPIKDEVQAASETIRERHWNWWLTTARTRLMKDASVVLVLTRWHEDDLAGRVLAQAKQNPKADQWEVLNLPAFAEEDDPLGRDPGDALCPALMPREALETTRETSGSYVWNALYQQRPSAAEGNILLRKDWRYYPPEWLEPETWSGGAQFQRVWQSWDTALKDKTTSDYTVGQLWGQDLTNRYLLRQVRGRWGLTETTTQVEQMTAWAAKRFPKHGSHAIYVENAAMGPELMAAVRKKVQGVIPVQADRDKVSRAYAITPQFEAHHVFIPGRANETGENYDEAVTPLWAQELVDECASFPNAPNDDQVDALTQALDPRRLAGEGRRGRVGTGGTVFTRR
jgi:predicted phage terminase large subunit-like protein